MRAIAILTVVFAHGNPLIANKFQNLERFNFDGVMLFFVLSGYLIGRILILDFQTRGCQPKTIINFWSRRWLRTLPAYICILTILIIAAIALNRNLPSNVFLYYVFSQNIAWPHPSFFGEAWSLAIEEWFYLIIPLMIFFAVKMFRQRGCQNFCV